METDVETRLYPTVYRCWKRHHSSTSKQARHWKKKQVSRGVRVSRGGSGRKVSWKGKKVSEGKARMKKKCCLSTFGSRCCSRVSRVSQQDMRARRGDTRGDLLHHCGSYINTHTSNQQHRNRPINRSPLSSNISERLDLESPYVLSHCIASSH